MQPFLYVCGSGAGSCPDMAERSSPIAITVLQLNGQECQHQPQISFRPHPNVTPAGSRQDVWFASKALPCPSVKHRPPPRGKDAARPARWSAPWTASAFDTGLCRVDANGAARRAAGRADRHPHRRPCGGRGNGPFGGAPATCPAADLAPSGHRHQVAHQAAATIAETPAAAGGATECASRELHLLSQRRRRNQQQQHIDPQEADAIRRHLDGLPPAAVRHWWWTMRWTAA